MGLEWVYRIPLMVFTKIKTDFSPTLKEKYNMSDVKNFSTVGSSDTPAVFPFVYVKWLPSSERGRTFEREINGGKFAFQIEVFDNQTQSRTRIVMTEVARIMNQMGFISDDFGTFEDTADIHRMISRFSRVIGVNDNILL